MPPPGRSPASTTCTRRPAADRRSAAASPLGPAPTTTASGCPFTAPSSGRGPRPAGSELGEPLVRGAEGVGVPRHHLLGEGAQRGGPVHVTHASPQRGQRDCLDLACGPLGAAAMALPGGLEPLPVLLDLGQHFVDAVVFLAR